MSQIALFPRLLPLLLITALSAHASSYDSSNDLYQLDQATAITVGAPSAADFSFSFDTASGLTASADDTNFELTAGYAYTFTRGAGSHPFAILSAAQMDALTSSYSLTSAPDGWTRSGFLGGNLAESASYNASSGGLLYSGPGGLDPFTWTPTISEAGTYYYNCGVSGHGGMLGQITVVPEPATSALLAGLLLLGYSTLRRRTR
jgi:hypothetical protein